MTDDLIESYRLMDALIEFLRARLDDTEGPSADAKRGLLEIAYLNYIDDRNDEEAQRVLRLLGLFDSGHTDYRLEWRPVTETEVDELVTFLRERLAEDDPAIAEHKRVLIALYEDAVREFEGQPTEVNRSHMDALRYTVRVLAEAFASHRDYDEEWRP